MMFWYGDHGVFWEAALMWLVMIAFWGLVIWLVYYFVVSAIRDARRHEHGDSAPAILDQRLARGEIDAEEYRRLRDLLAHDDRTPVGTGDRR